MRRGASSVRVLPSSVRILPAVWTCHAGPSTRPQGTWRRSPDAQKRARCPGTQPQGASRALSLAMASTIAASSRKQHQGPSCSSSGPRAPPPSAPACANPLGRRAIEQRPPRRARAHEEVERHQGRQASRALSRRAAPGSRGRAARRASRRVRGPARRGSPDRGCRARSRARRTPHRRAHSDPELDACRHRNHAGAEVGVVEQRRILPRQREKCLTRVRTSTWRCSTSRPEMRGSPGR